MQAFISNRQLTLMSVSAVFAVIVVCLSFYINYANVRKTESQISYQQLQFDTINRWKDLHDNILTSADNEQSDNVKALIFSMSKETKPRVKSLLPFDQWLDSYRLNEAYLGHTDERHRLFLTTIKAHSQQLQQLKVELLRSIRQFNVTLEHQLDQFFIVFTASIFLITCDIALCIYFFSKQILNSQKDSFKQSQALQNKHARLTASINEKSNLLRMLNQEVRSPLHQISGVTDMLEKDLHHQLSKHRSKRTDDIRGAERVGLLKHSVNELLVVLNNVVSYTEIDSGVSEVEMEVVDMQAFFQSLYKYVKPFAVKKQLHLSFSVSEHIPNDLHLDTSRVNQVLVHLLKNAIKYTVNGEARLHVSLLDDTVLSNFPNPLQIKISHKPHIVFTISDTGCGLSLHEQNLINSAWIGQVNQHNQFATSCLGMAITQKLIGFMHGFLYVQSELGKGSNIFVMLPLNKVRRAEKTIQRKAVTPSIIGDMYTRLGSPVNNNLAVTVKQKSMQLSHASDSFGNNRSLRILIAEDIESNADLLTWMLEDLGHYADVTENGLACLEQLKKYDYDLIFMDQFMPVMDGQTATIKIRCMSGKNATIPIVGCTADPQKSTCDMLIGAGQNLVMTKPVQLEKLKSVLNAFQIKG